MPYYNYHALIKNKIKEGKLIRWELVKKWNSISPAIVFYFSDHNPMPIREYKFEEYFALLEELNLL